MSWVRRCVSGLKITPAGRAGTADDIAAAAWLVSEEAGLVAQFATLGFRVLGCDMVQSRSSSVAGTKIRQGRPPKIALDDIIAAALEIGLDRATVKNVADKLGVTAPGLWYHVRTRDELLSLVMQRATQQFVGRAGNPADFREALSIFSHGLFTWLSDHPVIIAQIATHRIVKANVDTHLQWLLKHAAQNGVSKNSALRSIGLVTAAVIGAATLEANRRAARTDPDGDSAGHFLTHDQEDQDFFLIARIVIDNIFDGTD
jgi:AcrR family transcriptional regulator